VSRLEGWSRTFRSLLRHSLRAASKLSGADWAVLVVREEDGHACVVAAAASDWEPGGRDTVASWSARTAPSSLNTAHPAPLSLVLDQGIACEATAAQWFGQEGPAARDGDISGDPIVYGVPVRSLGAIRGALLFCRPAARADSLPRVAAAVADHLGELLAHEHDYLVERRLVGDLRRSRQMLVQAEERIRREVAEEIHGSVQNALLLIAHRVDQVAAALLAEGGSLRLVAELSAVGDEIRGTPMNRLRRISHRLYPFDLQGGVVPALKVLVGSWHRTGDVDLDIAEAARAAMHADMLCPACSLALYRFVEEGLGNAFKHAQPTHVRVSLSVQPTAAGSSLVVGVEDDGCGFDSARVKRGLGLSAIRVRMEEAGARWHVTSEPARGTLLEGLFVLPCDHMPSGAQAVVASAALAVGVPAAAGQAREA
jgi:signal transduction histidine kinase